MAQQLPFKRVFLIVMDSVGIGEAKDAEQYNDKGADTLGHIAEYMGGLNMPNMETLGLGNIRPSKGIDPAKKPLAYYTKIEEATASKDTMTGNEEMMGLYINKPLRTFLEGFPADIIRRLEEQIGRSVIGNKPASGTAIIEELGEEHMQTGSLIVYTSADSVL